MLEADHLGLLASDPDAPRVLEGAAPSHDLDLPGLGDRGETARELANHALGLPLAQGIERDARLAEVEAELLRALGLADDRRHVQERLGGDAALVEAGAAEPLARVHHHRLEPQFRAAERRGVPAGSAAQDGDIHLVDEIAHHHGSSLDSICTLCI